MAKRTVVIGFLGTTLDAGVGEARWHKWRPTVNLCQHEDLLVHRLEILHNGRNNALAQRIAEDIGQISPETAVRQHVLAWQDPWDFEEVYEALHEFARGYAFDTEAESYLIHMTTGTHVAQICLFLLTEAHYFPGRLLQISPPRHMHSAAPGTYRIIDLDLSKYDRIASRFQKEAQEATTFLKSGIATRNADFNQMIDEIEQVAIRSRLPVLLMGPTGAGKSLLARRIFELKRARHQVTGPFLEVNGATLHGDAAMSALFGHKAGAFTGALKDRQGLLRRANGGVLFLDEVGELGLDEQAMILRAIEEQRFLPMGSDEEVQSDFQLIGGTNRDLFAEVRAGRFREDLLARLAVWVFHLPALADRREDIEPNIHYELQRYAKKHSVRVTFNKEAWQKFMTFALAPEALWSGNFRDLAAAITRMATLARGGRITEGDVTREMVRLRVRWQTTPAPSSVLAQAGLVDMDLFDQVQLLEVIRVCRESPSLSEAGRRLFSVSRQKKKASNDADRLRKYLQKFGLDWQSVVAEERGRPEA